MKQKFIFWLLLLVFFGDLLYGGIGYVITPGYWGYQPIPITLIDSAGFTLGFSLLLLIPYLVAFKFLWQKAEELGAKYRNLIIILASITLLLYGIGFIYRVIRFGF